MMKLADKLFELRKEKGLTQADLAKVLNTNQSQYGKYENGKTNLTVENAKILANYFGVTLPYLLGLDDNSGTDGSKKMTPFQSLVRDRRMSLKEISEATGIGYSTVGNYNQGSRIPNARNAQLLSEYFGVSIPYLLGYEENSMANKPNATILIELVKELSFISEKKSKLLQEYIELDKKERDIIKQIKEINPDYVTTDCETCKWQIEMSTGYDVKNPISILAEALDVEETRKLNSIE